MNPHRHPTRGRAAAALALLLALAPPAGGAQDAPTHLGVVTCAGSNCHGAGQPSNGSRVTQDEFLIWHREDRHAQAWRSLTGERGQRIARNLGLADAGQAPECLRCHSGNVPPERRGRRYQVSDGVGCETCHGAASGWLGLHVTGEASREEALGAGMYPTDEPIARARLCLSCHLGDDDRLATHRIMSAGHPRLGFELATFTALQPAHYRVDADYRARKTVPGALQTWALGQVLAARRALDLFRGATWRGDGAWPELAFFDCHACHHSFEDRRWAPRETTGLGPGSPRLNDATLLMLLALAGHLDADLATRLHDGLRALHAASAVSMDEARAAAGAFDGVLQALQDRVQGRALDAGDAAAVLARVVQAGARGDYRDYAAAEQAAMAVATLLADATAGETPAVPAAAALAGRVQALYDALADEDAWQPERYVAGMRDLQSALP